MTGMQEPFLAAQRLARYTVMVAIQGADAARIEVELRFLAACHFATVSLAAAGVATAGGSGQQFSFWPDEVSEIPQNDKDRSIFWAWLPLLAIL
jgi:hypothetical protein